ncbi:MAG: hypothetical protein AAFX78_06305 [Cyanobacteria bacterium J06638_20]
MLHCATSTTLNDYDLGENCFGFSFVATPKAQCRRYLMQRSLWFIRIISTLNMGGFKVADWRFDLDLGARRPPNPLTGGTKLVPPDPLQQGDFAWEDLSRFASVGCIRLLR